MVGRAWSPPHANGVSRVCHAVRPAVDGGVVKPAEALCEIPKNREARIDLVDKDGAELATQISFKGPIRIAPEKLSNYAEVERLVAPGPDKGNYTLIDSRPLPRVQEGTIPTAINLPYPAWDKFVYRLPKDKRIGSSPTAPPASVPKWRTTS